MSDEYQYPHSVARLPVVPESGKPVTLKQPVAESEPPEAAPESRRAEPSGGPYEPASAPDPTRFIHQKLIEGKVIEAVQKVYDPEIPVNIYELGLIYDIAVNPDDSVHVKMTLTAPACPVAGSLPGEVERQIETIPEVKSATVELVWDPPWSRDRMSEAAQLQLGLI